MTTRCYRHLSVEERETLSLGLAQGHSLRTMAVVLGRAPSTVIREVRRKASRNHTVYRASTAQPQATARSRQRRRKLANPCLWAYVRAQLTQGCSPEREVGSKKWGRVKFSV